MVNQPGSVWLDQNQTQPEFFCIVCCNSMQSSAAGPRGWEGFLTDVTPATQPQQTRAITSANPEQLRILLGVQDVHLRRIHEAFPVRIVAREGKLMISGGATEVEQVAEIIERLIERVKRHKHLSEGDVEQALKERPFRLSQKSSPENGLGAAAPPMQEMSDSPSSENSAENAEQKGAPASKSPRMDRQKESAGFRELPSLPVAPRSEGQHRYLRAIDKNDLVFCSGPAGSGKTYLAVAMALHCLRSDQVRKIVLVRPAVEAGEKLGFLPGDMLAKVNPFLRPLLDALRDMLEYEQVQSYMEHDVIEIVPLAFMRGRTLNETFMILDEAQNTTVTQMKMFLTRMGTGSKIVVTGDETQNDLPSHVPSGLNDAMRRLRGIPGTDCVRLDGNDIVRHRLVREIVKAYDEPKSTPPTTPEPAQPNGK